MIGAYVRLAPAELARVLDDPAWGEEHVEALLDAEDGRCFDVDKAWDAIGFLVRRADFPVDVVHGGEDVDGATTGTSARRASSRPALSAFLATAARDGDAVLLRVE
jgi:hypothetical protein